MLDTDGPLSQRVRKSTENPFGKKKKKNRQKATDRLSPPNAFSFKNTFFFNVGTLSVVCEYVQDNWNYLEIVIQMPRLRRVQLEKYNDLQIQDEGIEYSETQKHGSRKANTQLYRGCLILLVSINFIFTCIPYYRRGRKTVYSALSCLLSFLALFQAFPAVRSIEISKCSFLRNQKVIMGGSVVYAGMIGSHLWYSQNLLMDGLYLVPLILVVSITNCC